MASFLDKRNLSCLKTLHEIHRWIAFYQHPDGFHLLEEVMNSKITTAILSLCTVALLTSTAIAKDFAPETAADLQTDLSEAAGNNEHDTITLAAMTYRTADNGNQSFEYSTTKDFDLTLIGQGMGQSILDNEGIANNRVMLLETSGTGHITVQGVTIQGGLDGPGDGTGIEVDVDEGDIHFLENEVRDNTAPEVTGINLRASGGDVFVERCHFINNTATQVGSSGIHTGFDGNIVFQDNVVRGNYAYEHAGMSMQSSDGTLTVNRNLFIENHATDGDVGAALMYSSAGEIIFTNNIVSDNSASGETGGVIISSNHGDATVVHNTITSNTAGSNAGGININVNDTGITRIYNNIVFGNQGMAAQGQDIFIDDIFTVGPVVELFNNDFSEFCFDSGSCDPTSLGTDEGGNLNLDPLFVNAAANDFHLKETSPVLNNGNKDIAAEFLETDFNGLSRAEDSAPDMGALEFKPEPPVGDGNSNGNVSLESGGCSMSVGAHPTFLWGLWLLALPWTAIRFSRSNETK